MADIAGARLVEGIKADDHVDIGDAFGKRAHGAQIMILQPILDVLSLDYRAGGEIGTGKEQRPHDAIGRHSVIAAPAHHRIAVLPPAKAMVVARLHQISGIGSMKAREVQPSCFERPARRAIAARHSAPYILVKIDKDVQAMPASAAADLGKIIEIGFVIRPRRGVSDCFPRRQQPQAVEAPVRDPGKVAIDLGQRRWPPDEADIAVVGKIGRPPGLAIGREWHLAVTAQVDAAQDDLPAGAVSKTSAIDGDCIPVGHRLAPAFCSNPASNGNAAAAQACG